MGFGVVSSELWVVGGRREREALYSLLADKDFLLADDDSFGGIRECGASRSRGELCLYAGC